MGGVALAAGGFIITATVYIFKLERYHTIVRSAVLTAFLGYVAVAVGLLFDLGLPWNIWHVIVFWNPHSPLFEVGWCVMLYLTVLSLEFFPVPAEEFSALARIRRFLIQWRLPLVIAGIGLSILHQSSLGSLFLIMPYRLHPLWYSPILPVIFLVSAIGLGLFTVIFESHFTAYLYRRKPETELLAGLGGAARWVLILYLLVRLGDLVLRGQIGALVGRGWQVPMFWFELALMAVVPTALLFVPAVRRSQSGQWAAAAKDCSACHKDLFPAGALIQVKQYRAVGYAQAMHQLCLGCHVRAARQKGKPDLARCANCHKEGIDIVDAKGFSYRTRELAGARSVLPPY
jgi:Ni/Fe-hydrogenase subunit HybB-like protein